MTVLSEAEKTAFKKAIGEVFAALNSVSWKTLKACTCMDSYGIPDPNCLLCGGDGVTENSTTISADVQEITGDERIAVEAGILERGDLIVRTLATNNVKVGDIITHSSKDYEVKFVRPDQIEAYIEIGCGKRV